MATAGETFLRAQHLTLLNRLRRMGTGKMKLASDLTPEKRAAIVKRLVTRAMPITEGVIPKEAGFMGGIAGMMGKAKSLFSRPALAKATVGVASKVAPAAKMAPAMSAAPKMRPTTPPGARAQTFGTHGHDVGSAFSSYMDKTRGPGDSGGYYAAEAAREFLKQALLRRRA